MTYHINPEMLVSNVMKVTFDENRPKDFEHNMKMFQIHVAKCKAIGWETWLRSMKESKQTMIAYFNKLVNPVVPFTNLIVVNF